MESGSCARPSLRDRTPKKAVAFAGAWGFCGLDFQGNSVILLHELAGPSLPLGARGGVSGGEFAAGLVEAVGDGGAAGGVSAGD